MGKNRKAFTMIELSVTIGVFAVFMLFFVGVFQVIFRSMQLNKQIAAKMYAETQLENAFSLIARELQWGGSMSQNLARTTIQRPDGSTAALTAFGSGEFGEGSATATSDGQAMKLKYAQVEKGIIRKLSSYDAFYTLDWDADDPGTPVSQEFFKEASNIIYVNPTTTVQASQIYFSYIGGSKLNLGSEPYWPTSDSTKAAIWVFSMGSLSEISPATLTYWNPFSHTFKTQIDPLSTPTGFYHSNGEKEDYLLTLAYEIPEYPPTFKGIDIGGSREYFGEVISKTTFWVEDGSKLKMSKYVPTADGTITQTLFEPIKAATFTIHQDYVQLDLIYLIPDPANTGQEIEFQKQRKFWTLGAG